MRLAAYSLVAGEHLLRNVPTFGRDREFARGFGSVTRRVAIPPGGPSFRIGAGRAAATAFVTAQNHPYGAAALRQPRAAPRVSSSVIVENVRRRQVDV
jgi:hypothetical protein